MRLWFLSCSLAIRINEQCLRPYFVIGLQKYFNISLRPFHLSLLLGCPCFLMPDDQTLLREDRITVINMASDMW